MDEFQHDESDLVRKKFIENIDNMSLIYSSSQIKQILYDFLREPEMTKIQLVKSMTRIQTQNFDASDMQNFYMVAYYGT